MPKLRVIIKPPPEPQGEPEQQVEALRDYLLQMSEELAYVLTHLEADNINDSTFERIQGMIPRPYTGLPVMDGDASSGQSEQWSRGDHRHPKDTSKADVTALATETAAREAHEADTGNPHEVTKAQVGLGNVANERQYSAQNPPPIPTPAEVGAIPATEKGSAGGVAELDSNGMVPSAQLPSYVDDVLEYASLSVFPVTGESGKIYVALDTGRTYRWSGSAYVEISESLALGETSSTAYRGDRGKTAYDHSQTTGNPHGTTAAEVGLGNVDNVQQYSALNPPPLPTPADIGAATAQDLTDHVGDTNNPHGVTAAQVGLGNVDNVQQYSASNPPPVPDAEDVPYDNTVSGLTATDLQAAVDELAGGGGGGGPSPSDNNPVMDGTAAPGVSTLYSRSDHVHPTDTSRQAAITASGILKGDGQGGVSAATAGTDYQAPLTIDATPTASSTNPVQSGGVYTDVRTRVPVYGLGKNLLDNWYFGNPVNQRGETSYSAPGGRNYYTIDRWFVYSAGTAVSVGSGSITLGPRSDGASSMAENLDIPFSEVAGKSMSISCLLADGSFVFASNVLPTTAPSSNTSIISAYGPSGSSSYFARLGYNNRFYFILQTPTNTSLQVVATKLELGTEQTLCHNEGTDANPVWVLNEVPDYEYELYRCMTSTADSTDPFANKSIATEQQLAYVETGTTASRNYEMEEWIAWQGKIYKTDKGIPAGTTFYTTGGNKNLTEEESGGLNSVNSRQALINGNVTFEVSGRTAIFRSNDNVASSTDIRNTIIPQYYRPKNNVSIPIAYYNGSSWVNEGRFLRVYSGAGNVIISNLLGGIDNTLTFTHSVFCATWTF